MQTKGGRKQTKFQNHPYLPSDLEQVIKCLSLCFLLYSEGQLMPNLQIIMNMIWDKGQEVAYK